MARTKRVMLLSLVLGLSMLTPRLGNAALAVYDSLNHIQNTITAVQTVAIVANQLLELTPLDELLSAGGMAERLDELMFLISEAEGLSWDLRQLEAQFERLFAVDALPDTTLGMVIRRDEVVIEMQRAWRYSLKVQRLINGLFGFIEDVLGFLDRIGGTIGNLQISQTLTESQQQVKESLARQEVMNAAFQNANAIDRAEDVAETEIVRKINRNVWANWPGMESR